MMEESPKCAGTAVPIGRGGVAGAPADRAPQRPSAPSSLVTREEAELFLAQYHEEVWDAASDEDSRVAYDEAGEKLAEAFLARFDPAPSCSHPSYGYTLVENGWLQGLERRARVMTSLRGEEVWYWQGDGMDFPESLACPVVMAADTLRKLLADAAELERLRALATSL